MSNDSFTFGVPPQKRQRVNESPNPNNTIDDYDFPPNIKAQHRAAKSPVSRTNMGPEYHPYGCGLPDISSIIDAMRTFEPKATNTYLCLRKDECEEVVKLAMSYGVVLGDNIKLKNEIEGYLDAIGRLTEQLRKNNCKIYDNY